MDWNECTDVISVLNLLLIGFILIQIQAYFAMY